MKLPTRQGQMGVCGGGGALALEGYHAYYPPCRCLSPSQDGREGQGGPKQGVQWARQAGRLGCTLEGEQDTLGAGTHLLSLSLLSKIGSPLEPNLLLPHCWVG